MHDSHVCVYVRKWNFCVLYVNISPFVVTFYPVWFSFKRGHSTSCERNLFLRERIYPVVKDSLQDERNIYPNISIPCESFLCFIWTVEKTFHSNLCNNFSFLAGKHLLNYFCIPLKFLTVHWNYTAKVNCPITKSEDVVTVRWMGLTKREYRELREA